MPEAAWKAYIDFEIEEAQASDEEDPFCKVRELYNRLLELTKHVKVWLSYARFEHETSCNYGEARKVFK
jgi:crooked neck